MLGFNNNIDDGAIEREERELKQFIASIDAQSSSGPSDAYWDMLPQRVMARIRREEKRSVSAGWTLWWKPAISLATMSTAVIAFIAFHTTPVTLDQVTASFSDDEMQMVEQVQTGVAPVSSDEQAIVSDIASQVSVPAGTSDSTDLDAVLTIDGVDPSQIEDDPQPELPMADQATIENLNDQQTDEVIQSLKTSL
ncbi:MAG TPA: hypothetical protein VFA55_09545 [Candidatus Kapabacteria bacterium]|nr:hypothetical protein [Candidatus Kapabacteria bacterium]